MSHTSSVPLDVLDKNINLHERLLSANKFTKTYVGHERVFSIITRELVIEIRGRWTFVNGVVNFKALKFQENHAYGLLFILAELPVDTQSQRSILLRDFVPVHHRRDDQRSFRAVDPKDGESGRRDTASDMW